MIEKLLDRLRLQLWQRQPANWIEGVLLTLGRYSIALVRDFMEGQLSMRAMSLVYTTLLSLVPLLALSFSMLKAFGVHNALEPMLLEFLRPLGPQAQDVTQNIIGFVENIKVSVLGSVGVSLLLYSAIALLQKVEGAFNFLWRLKRPRSFGQRFGEYLSVLIVGPVLVFSAIGITTALKNSAIAQWVLNLGVLGPFVFLITQFIPYLLVVAAFTFLYAFIPNIRVRFTAALAGALLAGILWQSASLAFASFVSGATNYNAIYSGFAIVVFLLIWLYVGWLILLIGCQLSFYVQCREYLMPSAHTPFLSAFSSEYLALSIVGIVGQRFMNGQPGPQRDELAKLLGSSPEHVDVCVQILLHHKILLEAEQELPTLMPARDFGGLTLGELWLLVRSGFDSDGLPIKSEFGRRMRSLVAAAERGFAEGDGKRSVRDWLIEQAS